MYRMIFEKSGNAIWISHLDLMRVFQRAFKRADLSLTHTQGFNPRPSVSIALPMSVGISSFCELLDFDLDSDAVDCEEIKNRLNAVLVEGVHVNTVYQGGRKLRDLSLLSCVSVLEYDNGVPTSAKESMESLFNQDVLIVPKKTKSGIQDQNISTMIRNLEVSQVDNTIILNSMICCQNPTLNPQQLISAVKLHLPQFAPDFAHCSRIEIYDTKENVFR